MKLEDAEANERQKLTKAEIGIVASSGVIGLIGLVLIAWLLLPISGHIVPFVVAGAFPLFTLLAVIYQAVVYRRQWNAMLNALRQTDRVIDKMQAQLTAIREQTKVMQDSLAESQALVKHSQRDVEIAEQNMEYAQRAYVSVTKYRFVATGFYVTIENSGNTPASSVSVQTAVDAGSSPPKLPSLDNQNFDYSALVFLGLLAPRSPLEIFVRFKRSLTPQEEKDFTEYPDLFHWWITGSIYYEDIFHQEIGDYRETSFCFYYDEDVNEIRAHSSDNEAKEYRSGKQINKKPY